MVDVSRLSEGVRDGMICMWDNVTNNTILGRRVVMDFSNALHGNDMDKLDRLCRSYGPLDKLYDVDRPTMPLVNWLVLEAIESNLLYVVHHMIWKYGIVSPKFLEMMVNHINLQKINPQMANLFYMAFRRRLSNL